MKKKVMTLLLLVLAAVANSAIAQEAKLAVPVTLRLPPPVTVSPPIISPPVCLADSALKTLTAADSEPDDPEADISSLTIIRPVRRCEDGPVRKLLGGPNIFYWPPIYQRTCNNLFCKDPPCIARKTRWVWRCVLVYKFVNGCWRRWGFRNIRYLDHLECGCKQCRDIKDRYWCERTKPCPNTKNEKDFCYWIPGITPIGKRQAVEASFIPVPFGRCDCCTPKYCVPPKVFDKKTCSCKCPPFTCPPGRIPNFDTCKCDCPPGSKPVGNKCIGDCKDISLNYCKDVACSESSHFNCTVEDYKCVCPSCDRAVDQYWCVKTKCQEQFMPHKCLWENNKCRCPTCKDQVEEDWCKKTKCGPYFKFDCRFDPYSYKCDCPYVKG